MTKNSAIGKDPDDIVSLIDYSSSTTSIYPAQGTGIVANSAFGTTIYLPLTCEVGKKICVVGRGTGGWDVRPQSTATQIIVYSGNIFNVQYIVYTNISDSVELTCVSSNRVFVVTGAGGAPIVSSVAMAVFAGGNNPTNVTQYIYIATTGNSTSFGNFSGMSTSVQSASSSTRGCYVGAISAAAANTIYYCTFAQTSTWGDFGDLSITSYGRAGCSSSTRGCFAGGYNNPTYYNVIDYITIASTGNATDFGDLLAGE